LGKSRDHNRPRWDFGELVFAVEQLPEMRVVDKDLVVCGGAGKSVLAKDTDNRLALRWCGQDDMTFGILSE
jgi:hypothetical protein